jgi:16S rRNA (uracil1498-N3)-methyltransferase
VPADRFFINAELRDCASVLLIGPEYHHLAHVMRLKVGEEVELVNGLGALGLGRVAEITNQGARIELLKVNEKEQQSPRIFLAVPLMRASKLEWIVEKGTELGAAGFLVYPAKYSEREDLSERQLERLHLLAVSALKQSGRLYLPAIESLPDMASLFVKEALFLFGDTHASDLISPSGLKTAQIVFISGPEKGFSEEELRLLEKKAKGVRLNPYILRAETAPIAAASILGMALHCEEK